MSRVVQGGGKLFCCGSSGRAAQECRDRGSALSQALQQPILGCC